MGEKKPPDSLAVFSGILRAFRALSLLSIRQRSEIPKEVKVKLGGHNENFIGSLKTVDKLYNPVGRG